MTAAGKISLNMLRQSRIHPHLSAYMHIFGELDYNRTLLAPLVTRIVVHNLPNNRSSLAPHGESVCYIVSSMEH